MAKNYELFSADKDDLETTTEKAKERCRRRKLTQARRIEEEQMMHEIAEQAQRAEAKAVARRCADEVARQQAEETEQALIRAEACREAERRHQDDEAMRAANEQTRAMIRASSESGSQGVARESGLTVSQNSWGSGCAFPEVDIAFGRPRGRVGVGAASSTIRELQGYG